MSDRFRIGVDVGGTFTDLFVASSCGDTSTFKVFSTPNDPSIAVMDGLREIAESHGLDLAQLGSRTDTIVHGTTVTTNAVLTRGGATVGLLTTQGVRDALEMRRGIREEQYNNRYTNVVPLVPRFLRRPVRGRLDYRGEEIHPLEPDDVVQACGRFRDNGVDAVAICFMNAFANPGHESAAAAIVREELPDVYLSVSSEVLPVVRFYNRVSTTVINAYVGPVLIGYLENLQRRLADEGFERTLLIMQSSGGVGPPEAIVARPATTLLSGPAAGPQGAKEFAQFGGHRSSLLADMGGTSFDASLARDRRVALKVEGDIDRLRIALPMLEIVTIGAGGGSIGRIDAARLLRMGPESAGSDPGPACYGRGGELPTCTDANVVLGYLDPSRFAGGKMPLQTDAARRAIEEHIAEPLQLDVESAAAGMYRVINVNMAHGLREITVKRGLDPREFPLVMAGGAGALHACMIADELEIPEILIPSAASVLCAVGMLMCDLQHDFVRSYVTRFSELDRERLATLAAEMIAAGDELLVREGVPTERREHEVSLDLRYLKQYHEVTVQVARDALESGDLDAIAAPFHAEHDRLYGYDLAEQGTELELINVRVQSVGRTDRPVLPAVEDGSADAVDALVGHRRAFVPERAAFADVPVYDGHRLQAGNEIQGPALIERVDTTILVSAGYRASVDKMGSARLSQRQPSGEGSSGGDQRRIEQEVAHR